MRTFGMLFAIAFAVSSVLVAAGPTPAKAVGKTHEMTVEVVSVDIPGKMITIKDDQGKTQTAPVLGKAVEELKTLKAGDKCTLTCQDNEKGEHQGVSAIKPAMAAAKY